MADLSKVFDEIVEKTEIVDVISNYVPLEKKGKNYFGICPFHNDTNPSMSVSPEKKIYKCFSCGASGNAISFVQHYENISFLKAAKKLADLAKVELVLDESGMESQNFSRYYKIMQEAVNFYGFYLLNTKEGQVALDYLRRRGIDEEIIKAFNIGLSSNEMDYLNKALTKNDYTFVDQMELGLIKSNGSNYYDSFRERIMFPIHDLDGNVVGLSGRIYTPKENEPKYVNSPENIIFHKGKALYHYHQAMPFIRKLNKVYLFEGFMDVIAAYKADVVNTVATMGTALTADHARAIKKLTTNVVLCFDGDTAGITATKRAIPILRGSNINIEAVLLPDGLDPDDFLNKYGAKKLKETLETSAVSVVEFLYRVSKNHLVVEDITSIERHKNDVFSVLRSMNSTVTTEVYLNKLSTDINVRVETLQQDYDSNIQPGYQIPSIQPPPEEEQPVERVERIKLKYLNAEKDLIQHMLYSSEYAHHIKHELGNNYVTPAGLTIMITILTILEKNQKIDQVALVEGIKKKLSSEELEYLNEVLAKRQLTVANKKLVDDCIRTINVTYFNEIKTKEAIASINKSDSPEETKQLIEQLAKYKLENIRK